MERLIYLDNAATTQMKQEVVEAMKPFLEEYYGNPSAVYGFATKCKHAVTKARDQIATSLGTSPDTIYFTSGGSEADNWALIATAEAYEQKGKHIITTKIEHHAILHTCQYLQRRGFEITYLDVDEKGMVDLEALKKEIRPDTILISVMYANNEVGTIEPIKEIGEIARQFGLIFHTDAVQAYGHEKIDVDACNIDLLSASAHKLYGPKGVGFLYIRRGLKLRSFLHGGGQERNRRAGTENVPAIVGFGKAVELAFENLEERRSKEVELRDYMIQRLLEEIPLVSLNGHSSHRLANNINCSFRFAEGESLLIMLDIKGVCASSGSACTSGSIDPSHVLLAMGISEDIAHNALRMTISDQTTKEDVDFVVDCLKVIVKKLRTMSPQYQKYIEVM